MNTFRPAAAAAVAATIGLTGALPALAQQERSGFPSFDAVDADLDGTITPTEFRREFDEADDPNQLFAEADQNRDDALDRQEWSSWREDRIAGRARSAAPMPAAGPQQPRQIEVSVTDEIIQGKYITDAGLVGLDGNSLAFGVLFSDDRDIVLSSELMAPGLIDQWLPPFISLSLGGKAYLGLLDDPDDDNFAIAPGVEARVDLPLDVPMSVVGRLFYAPDILAFGDSDTVIEFDTRFEVQFLEQTTGFVGYRVLNFEREAGGEDKIVNGIHAGVRFAF